jgi:hypothetical protein
MNGPFLQSLRESLQFIQTALSGHEGECSAEGDVHRAAGEALARVQAEEARTPRTLGSSADKLEVHGNYGGGWDAYYDPEGHVGRADTREAAIIDLMEQQWEASATFEEKMKAQRDEARAAVKLMRDVASEAFEHWDGDRDSKVGKLLLAMAGKLPIYRADITKALATISGS